MILWDQYLYLLHQNVNLPVFLHNRKNYLKWPIQYSGTLQILADLKLNKIIYSQKPMQASRMSLNITLLFCNWVVVHFLLINLASKTSLPWEHLAHSLQLESTYNFLWHPYFVKGLYALLLPQPSNLLWKSWCLENRNERRVYMPKLPYLGREYDYISNLPFCHVLFS